MHAHYETAISTTYTYYKTSISTAYTYYGTSKNAVYYIQSIQQLMVTCQSASSYILMCGNTHKSCHRNGLLIDYVTPFSHISYHLLALLVEIAYLLSTPATSVDSLQRGRLW